MSEITRNEFLNKHISRCRAQTAKKYDNTKKLTAKHTLEYSKRKCAKNLWRKKIKIAFAITNYK